MSSNQKKLIKLTMPILTLSIVLGVIGLSSCVYNNEFDNPHDPDGVNYGAWSSSSSKVGLSSSSTLAWTIKATDIDSRGWVLRNGASSPTGLAGPTSDFGDLVSGETARGVSLVLDKNDQCVGFCGDPATEQPNDPANDNWQLASLLNQDRISLKFKCTDYTGISKAAKGTAYAAYLVGPLLDPNKTNPSDGVMNRSLPMGLTVNSTISLKLRYTAGKKLYFQLYMPRKTDGSLGYETANHGSPRYVIYGTGADQIVEIPVYQVKFANSFETPDYSQAVAFGLLRIEEAGSMGASFPSSELDPTELDFMCASTVTGGCQ